MPAWFNIKKYRQVKAFDAAAWYQQLALRAIVDDLATTNGNKKWCESCWALLQDDPVLTIARLEAAYPIIRKTDVFGHAGREHLADYLIAEMTLSPHWAEGVRLVTNGEIQRAFTTLRCNYTEWEKTGRGKKDKSEVSNDEWEQYMRLPFESDCFGKYEHVSITRNDFTLPDAILIKNYAEYLRANRSCPAESGSHFFKNQDFASWYNSGVLPYLDLCSWGIRSGQTFRWKALVDAINLIADKPVSSEDTCRKTTKALADKLMFTRTIRMLHFQAVKEESGRYKKSGKLFVR